MTAATEATATTAVTGTETGTVAGRDLPTIDTAEIEISMLIHPAATTETGKEKTDILEETAEATEIGTEALRDGMLVGTTMTEAVGETEMEMMTVVAAEIAGMTVFLDKSSLAALHRRPRSESLHQI